MSVRPSLHRLIKSIPALNNEHPPPSHCFLSSVKGIPNHWNGSQPHLSGRNARVGESETGVKKNKHRIDLPLNRQQRKPGHAAQYRTVVSVQAAAVHSLARATAQAGPREINAVTPGNAIPSKIEPRRKVDVGGREDEKEKGIGVRNRHLSFLLWDKSVGNH